jgi:hypothetical protein
MSWNILRSGRFLSAYLLVILMLVGTVCLQQRDILFPEIAGMAMGVIVFPVQHWIRKPIHLWLSPTLGALMGTLLNDLSFTPLNKIWFGLVIIVILMHVFRVNFGPTIPATLLPIFIGLHDFVFVISTAIFTFVIMLAAYKMRNSEMAGAISVRKKSDTVLITLILCLWIWLASATKLDVLVVPPVFALIFESFHMQKFTWRLIPSRLAVLTLSAILSVGVLHLLPDSIIWVGAINVLITTILCKLFKVAVPVAFGVSLMPLIFAAWGTWWFPVGVFVTTGVLMSICAAYRQLRNNQAI